jgi:hypothetical protein
MLEIHLRYVRSFLEDAARKVPPELGIDFEDVLRKISSVPIDPTASPHVASAPSGDVGAGTEDPSNNRPGRLSHTDFLKSIIEFLDSDSSGQSFDEVKRLLDLPLADTSKAATTPLPPKVEAIVLINSLFSAQHPMLSFLHEQYFRDTVELVYNAESRDEAIDRFLPMLHIALALGYLFSSETHREHSCDSMLQRAMQHFLTGRGMLQPLRVNSMMALQTLLCAVVWLISTGRVAQAHPLIGLSVSLALRLGLHTKHAGLPAEETMLHAKVMVSIWQVDMHVSMLLDLPGFLQNVEHEALSLDEVQDKAARDEDRRVTASLQHYSLLRLCQTKQTEHVSVEGLVADRIGQMRVRGDEHDPLSRTSSQNLHDQR